MVQILWRKGKQENVERSDGVEGILQFFSGLSVKSSLRGWALSQDMEELKEWAVWILEGYSRQKAQKYPGPERVAGMLDSWRQDKLGNERVIGQWERQWVYGALWTMV